MFEYKCHLLSILQSEVRNKDTAYVTVWFNHKVCSTQKTPVGIIQNKHFIWLETSNLSVHLMLQSHQRKLVGDCSMIRITATVCSELVILLPVGLFISQIVM